MTHGNSLQVALLLSFVSATAHSDKVFEILVPQFVVSEFNWSLFATPIAIGDGYLYTVNVENSEPGSGRPSQKLVTRIRQFSLPSHGPAEEVRSTLVDRDTLRDRYHTQSSVGVDRLGFIHVAFNMHNMPWQYAVSKNPNDVGEMVFKGEQISDELYALISEENKTHFPGWGKSGIEGNQITYPRFFNDQSGRLYLTYRLALRPARSFSNRDFAQAIALFDEDSGRWLPIGGGSVQLHRGRDYTGGTGTIAAHPFLHEEGYTPYLPALWFDSLNLAHISWTWRKGGPGKTMDVVSYARLGPDGSAYDSDGEILTIPIGVEDARVLDNEQSYYARTDLVVTPVGEVVLLVESSSGGRMIYSMSDSESAWKTEGPSPSAAQVLSLDDDGNVYSFATGPKAYVRYADGWKAYAGSARAGQYCLPKVISDSKARRFLVHVHSCDKRSVAVLAISFMDRG